jgi:hypothetical protein
LMLNNFINNDDINSQRFDIGHCFIVHSKTARDDTKNLSCQKIAVSITIISIMAHLVCILSFMLNVINAECHI